MIKEQDLLDAIAECQGERNPDARTCIKLAAFYTILNNMYHDVGVSKMIEVPQYSFSEPSEQVSYDSGSEFSEVIKGLSINDVIKVMDELMEAVQLISPKLYNATLAKLNNL